MDFKSALNLISLWTEKIGGLTECLVVNHDVTDHYREKGRNRKKKMFNPVFHGCHIHSLVCVSIFDYRKRDFKCFINFS